MLIKGNTVKQGKFTFHVGLMKAKDLAKYGEIDRFIAGHPEGYQRTLSMARARSFGRFMENVGFSPASILINFREGEIVEKPEGILNLPEGKQMWIVDGQHRVGGLQFALERNPDIGELEFPVMIMNEPLSYEEAKQFVIINKTQKGVRTDLAERFLMQFIKKEGKGALLEMRAKGVLGGILKNVEWITNSIEIVDILNMDKTHHWYGKIRLPNEPKNGTTVAQKAFADSLEPVLKDSFFQGKNVQSIAAAVGNYWDAIYELCEAAFESPKDYVIEKTTGVFVLNKIFPRVAEFCRDEKGNRILTKSKVKSVLEGLPFMKAKYWEAKDGVAGRRGTSRKSFASLAMEALEALEKKRQDITEPDLITD
jgi:DGQHR domain-containing protein